MYDEYEKVPLGERERLGVADSRGGTVRECVSVRHALQVCVGESVAPREAEAERVREPVRVALAERVGDGVGERVGEADARGGRLWVRVGVRVEQDGVAVRVADEGVAVGEAVREGGDGVRGRDGVAVPESARLADAVAVRVAARLRVGEVQLAVRDRLRGDAVAVCVAVAAGVAVALPEGVRVEAEGVRVPVPVTPEAVGIRVGVAVGEKDREGVGEGLRLRRSDGDAVAVAVRGSARESERVGDGVGVWVRVGGSVGIGVGVPVTLAVRMQLRVWLALRSSVRVALRPGVGLGVPEGVWVRVRLPLADPEGEAGDGVRVWVSEAVRYADNVAVPEGVALSVDRVGDAVQVGGVRVAVGGDGVCSAVGVKCCRVTVAEPEGVRDPVGLRPEREGEALQLEWLNVRWREGLAEAVGEGRLPVGERVAVGEWQADGLPDGEAVWVREGGEGVTRTEGVGEAVEVGEPVRVRETVGRAEKGPVAVGVPDAVGLAGEGVGSRV